jgi:nitrate reductase delta subunit
MSLSASQMMRAWQLQSLAFAYPDGQTPERLRLIRTVANDLPGEVRAPLLMFGDCAEHTSVAELAADYVETFDHRRRCSPYLTYYAHGDTRSRGVALLKLKQRYARAGLHLTDDELPDHIAVLLEFAATDNVQAGQRLFTEHRAGLELLRLALTDQGSIWRLVMESLCATLPPLKGDDRQAVAKLAAAGPPDEEVGLAPFAPPEYVPQSAWSQA